MEAVDGGIWVDAVIENGQIVGGTHYTREEWDRKLIWERIEAMDKKLDAILALLQTR